MAEIVLAAIGVVAGGLISIAITIVVESMRRPKLQLSILDPVDLSRTGPASASASASSLRSLRVNVKNEDLPSCARWMTRAPASQCHGKITFHHHDTGQNVFGRQMQIRWASQPEPVPLVIIMPDKTQYPIWDMARLNFGLNADIAPGEAEVLDVAVRFAGEGDCYGWNNEVYSFSDWHNPKWNLGRGRYLVRVTMVSAGLIFSEIFRLVNDVGHRDFRLEKATRDEKQKVENNL